MRTFKKRQVVGLVGAVVWAIWLLALGPAKAFAIVQEYWEFSLTMVFGSLVAGTTSLGGGAVAFPVFTKVLAISPEDAKVFSLAIQSVGMGAASLAIVFGGVRIDWRVVFWGSAGAVVGIMLGALWLSPLVIPSVVKMSFTMMMAGFALTLWVLNRTHRECHDQVSVYGWRERVILMVAGGLGGVMSGLVGNGADIAVFSVMVLLFRVNEKVATPTSVVVMALNAMAGFVLVGPVASLFTDEIQLWWLAAVPVVVLGAPLGVVLCTFMSRLAISRLLIALIVLEVLSSLVLIPLTPLTVGVSSVVFVVFSALAILMSRAERYHP